MLFYEKHFTNRLSFNAQLSEQPEKFANHEKKLSECVVLPNFFLLSPFHSMLCVVVKAEIADFDLEATLFFYIVLAPETR